MLLCQLGNAVVDCLQLNKWDFTFLFITKNTLGARVWMSSKPTLSVNHGIAMFSSFSNAKGQTLLSSLIEKGNFRKIVFDWNLWIHWTQHVMPLPSFTRKKNRLWMYVLCHIFTFSWSLTAYDWLVKELAQLSATLVSVWFSVAVDCSVILNAHNEMHFKVCLIFYLLTEGGRNYTCLMTFQIVKQSIVHYSLSPFQF